MLRQFGTSTVVALIVGGIIAVALFVPVAAARYRRSGRLRFVDVATLLLVAVYFVALWSYTLVPLPAADTIECVGVQLRPFAFLDYLAADHRPLLRNGTVFQVLFNVVLFVPLGFFLRVLARRGVIEAALVGLGTSALIEFTQLTGVWGTYRCAFRVFDVDDLVLNTSGALIGALIGLPVAMVIEHRAPPPATSVVTLGRRWVGIAVDVLSVHLLGLLLVVGWRSTAMYGFGQPWEESVGWPDVVAAIAIPAAVELAWVLSRGQTPGEAAVGLDPLVTRGPVVVARLVKYLGGVGGYLIALALWFPYAWVGFVVVSMAMVLWTGDHRGLSHVLAGMELRAHTPGPVDQENSAST